MAAQKKMACILFQTGLDDIFALFMRNTSY